MYRLGFLSGVAERGEGQGADQLVAVLQRPRHHVQVGVVHGSVRRLFQ